MSKQVSWEQKYIDMLGKVPDMEVAQLMGISKSTVRKFRSERGIDPIFVRLPWSKADAELLGGDHDSSVATKIGKSRAAVSLKRARDDVAVKRKFEHAIGTWSCFSELSARDVFETLRDRYRAMRNEALTYKKLAEMTHYSESRMQKWFTPGSAQEPLSIATRHHFWLLARQWEPA